jgi:alpha-L-arabinofuranosidase
MLHVLTHRVRFPKHARTYGISALVGLVAIVAILTTAVLTTHKAKAAGTLVNAAVNVSNSSNLGAYSPVSYGVNEAAWDGDMTDNGYIGQLSSAGVQIMRYPGGSTADNFHWYNQSVTHPSSSGVTGSGDLGSNCPPPNEAGCGVNFDQFVGIAQSTGAQSMITVNYGSGTPQEAAAWVAYANTYDNGNFTNSALGKFAPTYAGASSFGNAYGIKYWEIGNEVYGNGTYGSNYDWEMETQHVNPFTGAVNLGPVFYAGYVNNYSKAMKAVDSSIKIGAVLTAPGVLPDGMAYSNDGSKDWNDGVLNTACNSIDFVDVHWYPGAPAGSGFGHEDDAQLLASPEKGDFTDTGSYRSQSINYMVSKLKKEISTDCGAHASAVQIMVTETNSVYGTPGRQTTSLVNALFEDDDIMTWLDNGASNVDWWAGHNSPVDGSTTNQATGAPLYGSYNFGDYGLISRGLATAKGVQEPPAGTPFPAYYGMQMLSHIIPTHWNSVGVPPPFLLSTSSDDGTGMVSVHAMDELQTLAGPQAQFYANVLLINKDPNNSYTVNVTLNNTTQVSSATPASVWTYGETEAANGSGITPSTMAPGTSFTITLQPYSLTAVNMPGLGLVNP